jgi:UDP-glucose 4-epimerase
VYIDDLVQGVLGALDKREHRYDAYHISSGAAPTLAEIVDIVNDLVPGARISIGPGPYRFGDRIESVRKGVLLYERATREFGYRPRYGIRAGIGAYIEQQRKT